MSLGRRQIPVKAPMYQGRYHDTYIPTYLPREVCPVSAYPVRPTYLVVVTANVPTVSLGTFAGFHT